MKKFLAYAAAGLTLATYSNVASAVSQTCLSIQSSVSSGFCTGSCLATFQANHPECFGSASSTASATQAISSTSLQQMVVISQAVNARFMASNIRPANVADSGQHLGMAAGNDAQQFNIWASVAGDTNKYNRGGFVDAGGVTHNNISNSNVTNAVIGGDYQMSPTVALGVSAAFDSASGNSESFTAGASNGISSIKTSGYSVAPYVGWQINDSWSLDGSLGFGTVKLNSSDVSGKANRLFYGANLSYAQWVGNWQLLGKGSYLHGEEKYGDLTGLALNTVMIGSATTNKVDQMRLGGQAGYWMNDSVMPYFGLAYSNDLSRSTSATAVAQNGTDIGKTAWVYSLGINFFSLKSNLTGGIAYNQEAGRTYAKFNSLMGNINYRF